MGLETIWIACPKLEQNLKVGGSLAGLSPMVIRMVMASLEPLALPASTSTRRMPPPESSPQPAVIPAGARAKCCLGSFNGRLGCF